MQVVEEPTRKGALLDLVLTNKERLVEDVKVGGRLDCSDHEMVEFRILHGGSRTISRIKSMSLQFREKDVMWDSVKCFAQVHVDDISCFSPL